jgi:hypothetical protein
MPHRSLVVLLRSGAPLAVYGFATTPGMPARGGGRHESYLGFNPSRKFSQWAN